jgi:predicted ABC-type sugar transport system permease subunit
MQGAFMNKSKLYNEQLAMPATIIAGILLSVGRLLTVSFNKIKEFISNLKHNKTTSAIDYLEYEGE